MRLKTRLDPETLRENPIEPDKLDRAIDEQRHEIETLRRTLASHPAGDVSAASKESAPHDGPVSDEAHLDVTRLARALNRLRDYLALDRQAAAALAAGGEALGIWEALHRKKATFLAHLSMAELQFDAVDQTRALATLDRLAEQSECEPFDAYRDFALETRAICRWRAGERKAAEDDAESALQIRRNRGADRLIDRTETILAQIQRDT